MVSNLVRNCSCNIAYLTANNIVLGRFVMSKVHSPTPINSAAFSIRKSLCMAYAFCFPLNKYLNNYKY